MKNEELKIFIIDDDESVRRSLSLLLRSGGYQVESYGLAAEFLHTAEYHGSGCILLDIFLDGRSGLELQEEISGRFENLPIIYITGQGDIPMSVQALKKGAINFLQKPVDAQQLFVAVEEALTTSLARTEAMKETIKARALYSTLTPKEQEIFGYLITGMLNKQVAAELNITEHTVKLHRGKITNKLGIKSIAEMVHLAGKLNIIQ
jgi:FixJ family two-component response regulator